jgi:hypothetical protein
MASCSRWAPTPREARAYTCSTRAICVSWRAAAVRSRCPLGSTANGARTTARTTRMNRNESIQIRNRRCNATQRTQQTRNSRSSPLRYYVERSRAARLIPHTQVRSPHPCGRASRQRVRCAFDVRSRVEGFCGGDRFRYRAVRNQLAHMGHGSHASRSTIDDGTWPNEVEDGRVAGAGRGPTPHRGARGGVSGRPPARHKKPSVALVPLALLT